MSFQRLSDCHRLLIRVRKNVISHQKVPFKDSTPIANSLVPGNFAKQLLLDVPGSQQLYSTNTKPHLSRSLLQWKQRKRKSKAQQKRELEKLQKDFTQLLTKRVVQLVQDNPYHNAQRQVITTHSFTNLLKTRTEAAQIGVTGILSHDSVKLDNFTEKIDACVKNMIHSGQFDHVKNLSSLHDVVLQSENDFQFFPSQQQQKNLSVGKTVMDYLETKRQNQSQACSDPVLNLTDQFPSCVDPSSIYPSNSKDRLRVWNEYFKSHLSSNGSLTDSSFQPDSLNHSQKENHFRLDQNTMKPQHRVNPKHHSSDFTQNSNEFLDLFSQFQEGMNKTGQVKHNWEKQEDADDTVIPSKPIEATTSSASSSFIPEALLPCEETINLDPISPVNTVNIDSIKKTFDSTPKPSVPPKSTVSFVARVDNPSLGKDLKGTVLVKQRKKRLKKKENKDFQELIDKSFVEACCFTGNELLAVRNIEFQSNGHGISSVEIFNRLIHALAKKQNLDAIKTLFSILRQGNGLPTLQTFAGCLECIGRMAEPDSFLCERLLADIDKAGLDIADIANSCSYDSDEWDHVIKAIRLVKPDFVPKEAPLASCYTLDMLEALESDNPKRLESNQYAIDMSKSDLMGRLERQMEIEKTGIVVVPSVVSKPKDCSDMSLDKLRGEVESSWRQVLSDSFTEKLKTFEKKAQNNMNMTVFPYLKLFPAEVYVDLIFKNLQELFSSSEAYSPTQVVFQSSMGRAVNRMYNIQAMVSAGMPDKIRKLYDDFANGLLDGEFVLDNHRKMWTRSMGKHFDTVNMDMSVKRWPRHVTKMVGKFLLDLILYDLKIDANLFKSKSHPRLVPAFCTIYRPDVATFTMAEIKVHPVVSKLFKMDAMEEFHFDPSTVPMLVPPVPWISKNMGGLLLGSYALIRSGDDLYHLDALKNVKDTQFLAVLDSLNTLSACAWKMNKPILDLQVQIFKANGDANLKVSPPASVLPPLPTIKADMTGQEKAALYRQRVQLQHQKQDMHGLWCSDLYRMSIANKFRDEIFWFPHSMDFRGRTYPLPPHFNHLGSDNVRGMLLFAKGKPLGPRGHDWLKIHLVNLTGFKKRSSNEERLAFADSVMEEILDSADNPLTGRKWWQSSDEPWQTLACCMELAKIARWEGCTKDYVCHFPVHQDGSCNGLQHYAALGRDQAGAESVNLMPFGTPQDVYSDVVELVERERKKDADGGHELAKALEGFIKRKVIKQTIMTTVYGVTRFGAKAQIHKQLKDIPEFPPDLAWKASFYLTEKTFSSLREMFTATKDIQDWLTDAAQLISAVKPVDWVTPLGFPVVQPYFKRCTDKSRNKYTSKPNAVKQKNAFPPNYIHSLDSTHMMLTSLYCMHAGITFVSVHDCFWTHACDVPIMNQICREQFVRMHSQPLLEDLSQHLINLMQRASNEPNLTEELKKLQSAGVHDLLLDVPKRGTFDLNNVLESTYFFS